MIQKRLMLLMMVLTIATAGCAPIDGLGDNEDEQAKTTSEMPLTTSAPPPTTAPPTTAPPTTASDQVAKADATWIRIDADALNVRSEPSMEGARLGRVFDNEVYEVKDAKEDGDGLLWYQLTSVQDVTGWVSSDYCEPGLSEAELLEEE